MYQPTRTRVHIKSFALRDTVSGICAVRSTVIAVFGGGGDDGGVVVVMDVAVVEVVVLKWWWR